jgi:hypothetical protein
VQWDDTGNMGGGEVDLIAQKIQQMARSPPPAPAPYQPATSPEDYADSDDAEDQDWAQVRAEGPLSCR